MKSSAKNDDLIQGIVKDAEERDHVSCVRQKLEEHVTNIQFLLQARINRDSGANLTQIKSRDIQGNLKASLGDSLEEVKNLAAAEFPLFFNYFTETTFELTSKIDEQAWQAISAVQDYNLANDFDSRFVFYLKNLNTAQLDGVLRLLILSHVKQRLERSVGLSGE